MNERTEAERAAAWSVEQRKRAAEQPPEAWQQRDYFLASARRSEREIARFADGLIRHKEQAS